jgi:hypothetical protein
VEDKVSFAQKYLVIGQDNHILGWIKILNSIICILSSFFYGFQSVLKGLQPGSDEFEVFICIESFFCFMMLLNFFEEFTPHNTTQHVRSHFLIAQRYILDKFLMDALCLIPFNILFANHFHEDDGDQRYFLLIKILRLNEGF